MNEVRETWGVSEGKEEEWKATALAHSTTDSREQAMPRMNLYLHWPEKIRGGEDALQ